MNNDVAPKETEHMNNLFEALLRRSHFFLVLLFLTGCGREKLQSLNDETDDFIRLGTWQLTALTLDGVASEQFSGMTLKFGPGVYTATDGAPVWPASGTWSFEGKDGKQIKRDDGLLVSIEITGAAEIVLSFDWTQTTYGPGRVSSTAGRHVMTFQRK